MNKLVLFLIVLLSFGCRPKAPATVDPPASTSTSSATPSSSVPNVESARFESAGRVVAIGDVHGDYAALQAALRQANVVDERGAWIAGETTLVQTGDLLDRGDDEKQIVDYIEALGVEATKAGGRVVALNGNHEVMNVAGDLRYVTPGGFAEFEKLAGLDLEAPVLERLPEHARARMAAFMPGGPYAKLLARKRVVAIVDDTVFAHGGVLEHHVRYGIDALNDHTSAWMRGERDAPMIMQGDDSPIWTRVYSGGVPDCGRLERTLGLLGAQRMVVGHTPQKGGITSACDQKLWLVDVGMAAHYGGRPAALEIDGDVVRSLPGPGSP